MMKHVMAGLMLLSAWPAAATAASTTCITSYQIDHTERPDDTQILFYMRDRSIYRATAQGRCLGLRNDPQGFTYEPDPGTDEICGNLFTIRLNTTGAPCLMGEITKIKAAKR